MNIRALLNISSYSLLQSIGLISHNAQLEKWHVYIFDGAIPIISRVEKENHPEIVFCHINEHLINIGILSLSHQENDLAGFHRFKDPSCG